VVVYETEDGAFARAAIEALEGADVDCYSTGGALPGGSTHTICIHLRRDADYAKANSILLSIGAARDSPLQIPSGWKSRFIIAAVVLVVLAFVGWLVAHDT
jgi:hypothetical protein